MLSHGSRAARTACVRCDLRCIIHSIPRTLFSPSKTLEAATPRCRHLTSTARKLQEYADEEVLEKTVRRQPYRYKHIHPHGRIIGRPGKRQRQSVETLSINSLGEESSVIVLRDVPGEDVVTSYEDSASAAADEAQQENQEAGPLTGPDSVSITSEETLTEQQAVQRSIDSMQPQNRLLEDGEYHGLMKRLVDAHNQRQLAEYMRSALAGTTKEEKYDLVTIEQRQQGKTTQKTVKALPKSKWRPGITPLAERHTFRGGVHMGRILGSPKEKLADQIIRNLWNITLLSEEQQLGELEMRLVPWQATLLFSTTIDSGHSQAERVIDSELLVQSSRLALSHVDSVLRIIARRQDAEEIAGRLERGILRAGTYVFDLEPYKILLGLPGRPTTLAQLWSDEELLDISQLTSTVMNHTSASKLEVHGFSHNAVMRATRLLKSLLNFEPQKTERHLVVSRTPTQETTELADATPFFCPIHLTKEQRRRFRGQDTCRFVRPTSAEGESGLGHVQGGPFDFAVALRQSLQGAEKFFKLGGTDWKRLSIRLRDAILKAPSEVAQSSCWKAADTVHPSKRRVEIGQLLYTDKAETLKPPRLRGTFSNHDAPKTFFNHVFAAPSLLSYFQSKPSSGAKMPSGGKIQDYVEVIYVPAFLKRNKAKPLEDIPRLTICFSRTVGSTEGYALKRVRAVLHERVLSVSLPFAPVDLRIIEEAHLVPNMAQLTAHPQVQRLCDALNQSLRNVGNVSNMYLPNSIMVPLPYWLLHGAQRINKRGDRSSRSTTLGNMDLASAAAWEDQSFAYFLEHVQLSRSTYYTPGPDESIRAEIDQTMLALHKQMLGSDENNFTTQTIRIREINGGPIEGRRTELSIHPPLDRLQERIAKREDVQAVRHDLIKTGLAVVDAITKIEKGKLQPLTIRRDSLPSSIPPSDSLNNNDGDVSDALEEVD